MELHYKIKKSEILIFSWKYQQNQLLLENIAPPNVAILHLLVYSGPILANFSAQKWDLKNSIIVPIIKSMFSFYNLKKGGKSLKDQAPNIKFEI